MVSCLGVLYLTKGLFYRVVPADQRVDEAYAGVFRYVHLTTAFVIQPRSTNPKESTKSCIKFNGARFSNFPAHTSASFSRNNSIIKVSFSAIIFLLVSLNSTSFFQRRTKTFISFYLRVLLSSRWGRNLLGHIVQLLKHNNSSQLKKEITKMKKYMK